MDAKEVLRRYSVGKRDFRNVDLCGAVLQGADLSGADFSGANIRSVNFTQANLHSANFTGAQGGRRRRWAIIINLLANLLVVVAELIQFAMGLWIVGITVSLGIAHGLDAFSISMDNSALFIQALFGYFVVIAIGLGLIVWRGLTGRTLWVCITVVAMVPIMFFAMAWGNMSWENISSGLAVSQFPNAAIAITLIGVAAVAIAVTLLAIASIAIAIIGTGITTVMGAIATMSLLVAIPLGVFTTVTIIRSTGNQSGPGSALGAVFAFFIITACIIVGIAVMFTLSLSVCAGFWVSQQACADNQKVAVIRQLGLRLKALGGTSFRGADLTATTFTHAQLQGVNFAPRRHHSTTLHSLSLQNAKQVNSAYFGRSCWAQQIIIGHRNHL